MGRRRRRRPELGAAPKACVEVEGRRSKDGTPLPPTPRDVGDRFLRDASGKHLCVVLDLDETLVCAYNHEVNGGVPPELSTGGCGENDAFHPAQGPSPRDPRRRRR